MKREGWGGEGSQAWAEGKGVGLLWWCGGDPRLSRAHCGGKGWRIHLPQGTWYLRITHHYHTTPWFGQEKTVFCCELNLGCLWAGRTWKTSNICTHNCPQNFLWMDCASCHRLLMLACIAPIKEDPQTRIALHFLLLRASSKALSR